MIAKSLLNNRMLQIVEIIDVLEQGVTEPIKCKLSDNSMAVVKYPNNARGTAVVVNEFIGYSLAKRLGITVPDFGICELSIDTIQSINDLEEIDERNAGLCFYTVELNNTVPKIIRGHVKNRETEKIILLDHILNNFDRHNGNLLMSIATGLLYVIDFSHIFSKGPYPNYDSDFFNRGKNIDTYLYNSILQENRDVYDELCIWCGYDEEQMRLEAKNCQELLNRQFIKEVLDSIPQSWSVAIGGDRVLQNIENFINFRIEHIDEICSYIILENRREP